MDDHGEPDAVAHASPTFHWDRAYAQLEAVRRSLHGTDALTPIEIARILARRAEAAAKPVAPMRDVQQVALVIFTAGGLRYAVEGRQVVAVMGAHRITPLPCDTAAAVGVVRHRGRVIAVFDPSVWFGVPRAPTEPSRRIIVIGLPGLIFGLRGNDVTDFVTLAADSLMPAPSTPSGVGTAYVQAITPDMAMLLDFDALRRGRRLTVDEAQG